MAVNESHSGHPAESAAIAADSADLGIVVERAAGLWGNRTAWVFDDGG